jgi:sulfatase maturation enzyme AslB (radical SAM superfamily)
MSSVTAVTGDTLPADAPPGFHLLAKPSGSTCNIDCTYCFFLSKEALYPDEKHRMSEVTLEAFSVTAIVLQDQPWAGRAKDVSQENHGNNIN